MSSRRQVFAPLEGAEYRHAVDAIVQAGLEPAEFVLEERRTDVRYPGGDHRVYKLVSVKRLTVGIQRQYNTGSGGGWPFEFERDLRVGLYGPRAPQPVTGAERPTTDGFHGAGDDESSPALPRSALARRGSP
jgi:hypothetical protein